MSFKVIDITSVAFLKIPTLDNGREILARRTQSVNEDSNLWTMTNFVDIDLLFPKTCQSISTYSIFNIES